MRRSYSRKRSPRGPRSGVCWRASCGEGFRAFYWLTPRCSAARRLPAKAPIEPTPAARQAKRAVASVPSNAPAFKLAIRPVALFRRVTAKGEAQGAAREPLRRAARAAAVQPAVVGRQAVAEPGAPRGPVAAAARAEPLEPQAPPERARAQSRCCSSAWKTSRTPTSPAPYCASRSPQRRPVAAATSIPACLPSHSALPPSRTTV